MKKYIIFGMIFSMIITFTCPGMSLAAEYQETLETVEESTEGSSAPVQYIQVTSENDYTEDLARLTELMIINTDLVQYVAGFCLFYVITIILYFVYKFFRLFI